MTLADLVDVVAPPETRPPELVQAIASHEAAHAVVTEVLSVGDLECVTLVQRGAFAGRSSARLRNPTTMTGDQVDDLVVSLLAGRAIVVILGDATSGAGGQRHSDLAIATNLVASKLASWGLGGSLLYRGDTAEVDDLLRLDRLFQEAAEKELRRLHLRALRTVRENRRRIACVAHRLLQARVLSGAEVRRIIETTPTDFLPNHACISHGTEGSSTVAGGSHV